MVTAGGGSSIGERGLIVASLDSWPWDIWGIGSKKQPLLEMATRQACLNAGDKGSEVKERLESRGS